MYKFYDEYHNMERSAKNDFKICIKDMLITKRYNGALTTEVRYEYTDYCTLDDERHLYFEGIPTTQDIIDRICDKEED